MWNDQSNQPRIIYGAESSGNTAQQKKFIIREISPGWGNASEDTKDFIIGSFLSDPSESAWHCMFGDIETPARIIPEGVLCCHVLLTFLEIFHCTLLLVIGSAAAKLESLNTLLYSLLMVNR
ncbi:hypothetical protein MKX01_007257 [Papaver californicum]|nr:hypothetical protein MKX01_007257 [Papaver californicum]